MGSSMMMKPNASNVMKPNAPNARPGDWECPVCNNHNYANRTECNKCKTPKGVFIDKAGMREGDWICDLCNNHNFSSRTACNKCGAFKADHSVVKQTTPTGLRPGDW